MGGIGGCTTFCSRPAGPKAHNLHFGGKLAVLLVDLIEHLAVDAFVYELAQVIDIQH